MLVIWACQKAVFIKKSFIGGLWTPFLKQEGSELTYAHLHRTVVRISLAVRVRRVRSAFKQTERHTRNVLHFGLSWHRPIYGNMLKPDITAVKFSQLYPLGILVGYLAAIYVCFLGVQKS